MPLTAFNFPGIRTVLPSLSSTFLPLTNFTRPASLISKAIALALRVEVEFRLTLYATKKSRAEMAVAPLFATLSLNFAGPKSGFQSGLVSFLRNPSYSPDLQLARFLLLDSFAAFS